MTTWIILVLFTAGTHNSDWRQIKCDDLKCVHQVIDYSRHSKLVSRIRVYAPGEFGYLGNGATPFLPYRDLTFSENQTENHFLSS